MKKLWLLLFVSHYFSFSQVTKITYTAQIDVDKVGMGEEYRISKARIINDVLKDIKFALLYDSTSSKFSVYEVTNTDKHSVNEALAFIFLDKPVYTYNKNIYEYGPSDLAEVEYLVKTELAKNWQLHKDTIIIDGYKCYKATYTYSTEEGNIHTDTAWYCPDIAGNYGPAGAGNLPGAILIYSHGFCTYTANDVFFNEKGSVSFPSSVKVLTEEEYKTLWKKWEEKEFGE